MKHLTRGERAKVSALENALDHEPARRPVLVEDYQQFRAEIHSLYELLERRVRAACRHPDEPGSRSPVIHRDGLAPYGTADITGFGEGCVF